jgi:23S rRNA (adenine2503-C2)-methyltransferase
MARACIQDLSVEALRARLAEDGLEPWRAEQIAAWLYARGVDDFAAMTDLGQELRERLAARFETRALAIHSVQSSADGTRKAVLRARDGALVESVLIPEAERTTLCVSSQVGCPLACAFCATGAMGFARNLTAGEIVDQACQMRRLLPRERRITNVVFMGMGEPLLNLPAVVEASRLLLHPKAFAMAPRRVTVSTVGIPGRVERLLRAVPVNLAVSLHATTDEVRDRLVPLNRRFPLGALLDALRGAAGQAGCRAARSRPAGTSLGLAELHRSSGPLRGQASRGPALRSPAARCAAASRPCVAPLLARRRPVFFEYTLVAGVNDGVEDARRLAPLLRGIPAKLNVIPMNRHPQSDLGPPPAAAVDRFVAEVAASGLPVTLRRSRGSDIHAACGQLALRPEPAPGRVG